MPRRPPPVGSEAVRKSDGQTRPAVLAMFAMAMLVLLSNQTTQPGANHRTASHRQEHLLLPAQHREGISAGVAQEAHDHGR
jgi:hypothetical protein